MQPINENDVLQVVVEGTNEATPWAWVSHWLANTIDTPETFLAALSSHVTGTFLEPVVDLLTDDWAAECLTIGRVAPQPMNLQFFQAGFPHTGTVTGDGVPNQSAVVVRFTTDEPGARNRGRMYLSGWPEGEASGGLVKPDNITLLNAAYQDLIDGFNVSGNSASMVIFSRTAYNPAADPPQAHTVYTSLVTGFAVQYNLGVIRRRRPKRSTPGA